MILHVDVVNKIATFQKRDGSIVCGNSDYKIKFSFDSEWKDLPKKTARFIWNGSFHDVSFTGDTCDVPVLYDTTEVEVGVYAGELKTTTSAFIGCYRSILCENVIPNEDSDRIYANEAKEAADRAEAAVDRVVPIEKIYPISNSGLVDTYEILMTNGDKQSFNVKNGASPRIILNDVDGGIELIVINADGTEYRKTILNGSVSGDNQGGNTGGNEGGNESGNEGGNTGGNEGGNEGGNTGGNTGGTSSGYTVYHGMGEKKDTTKETFMKEQSGDIDADFIIRLSSTSKTYTMKRTLYFEAPDNQYLYYAIPSALHTKTPTFQIEGSPFTGGFKFLKQVTVTKNDASIVYYVYRSNNLIKWSTTMNIIVS